LIIVCVRDEGPRNRVPATTTTSTASTASTRGTTSTASTTISTETTNAQLTTTSTSVTGATIDDCYFEAEIVFSLTNEEVVGALQYDVAIPNGTMNPKRRVQSASDASVRTSTES